jgi:hypothetical protein
MLITRPHSAMRRPWVVRMQAVLPSAILRPSFQQKQSGSGAWACRGGSSGMAGSAAKPEKGKPIIAKVMKNTCDVGKILRDLRVVAATAALKAVISRSCETKGRLQRHCGQSNMFGHRVPEILYFHIIVYSQALSRVRLAEPERMPHIPT